MWFLKLLTGDFSGGPLAKMCTSSAGGPGSISGQGTRPHVLQLKIPHAAMKTEDPEGHN